MTMTGDAYEVRPYDPSDREGFLDLYRTVMGGDVGDDWFDWKYADNPYTDHVPMYVARHDGELVGARPFFALPLIDGDRRLRALEPADAIVHPDHRRRGLFTRMTEAAIDRYGASGVDLFFNFPNELSGAGNLKLGWQVVDELETYYRIENPAAVAESRAGLTLPAPVGTASSLLFDAFRSTFGGVPDPVGPVGVERVEGDVPADALADLYERATPRRAHASRDAAFYDWRFDNPLWTYETYLGRYDGDPAAALVVGTTSNDGVLVTRLTEVLPLERAPHREATLSALLSAVVADHPATDLFVAPTDVLSADLVTRHGFRSDSSFPLSILTSPVTMMARPLTDDPEVASLTAGSDRWRITFVEYDLT